VKRALAALAACLLALAPVAAQAQSAPVISPVPFTFTAVGQQTTIPLNGQQNCAVNTYSVGGGATITLTTSSDNFATQVPASGINNGSITAFGNVAGPVGSLGIGALRLTLTALTSGTVSGTVSCGPLPGGSPAVTGNGFTHFPATTVTAGTFATICAGPCTLAALTVSWATTSTAGQCFLTLYNATAPTVGTGFVAVIPVNTTTAGGYVAYAVPPTIGGKFTTALTYAVTTTVTGSTACNVTANSLFVEAWDI
jgi:hypothetical protein